MREHDRQNMNEIVVQAERQTAKSINQSLSALISIMILVGESGHDLRTPEAHGYDLAFTRYFRAQKLDGINYFLEHLAAVKEGITLHLDLDTIDEPDIDAILSHLPSDGIGETDPFHDFFPELFGKPHAVQTYNSEHMALYKAAFTQLTHVRIVTLKDISESYHGLPFAAFKTTWSIPRNLETLWQRIRSMEEIAESIRDGGTEIHGKTLDTLLSATHLVALESAIVNAEL